MAKIIYEIYQNQVEDHPSNGKYFARVKTIETLNTRKMANHIAEHGSIYTPDVIFGVLEKFRSCLIEQLLNSRKVKIDGLGIFYLTAECAKGGAESPEKFNVQKNIEALHIRFLPDTEQETNISSRQFLKKASFINKAALFKDAEEDAEGSENSGSETPSGGGENQGGSSQGGTETPGGGETPGGNTGGGGDDDPDDGVIS
jgi:predicted histone-like DNA-binding protein